MLFFFGGRCVTPSWPRWGRLANLREGTSIHIIDAHMPVAESFNFTDELWTRTGGAAHAQLKFGHWATLDEDPFWVPRTEDDKEEFGGRLALSWVPPSGCKGTFISQAASPGQHLPLFLSF